jgi:DNA-binding NarL/FixJ family response regulator
MRATLYPELAEKLKSLGRRGQVLAGVWAGKGTKEIAADLGLSPKTVEYHRAQLYRVFGVNDLVSLCRRAIAMGLINPKRPLAKRRMPEALPQACHSESESES